MQDTVTFVASWAPGACSNYKRVTIECPARATTPDAGCHPTKGESGPDSKALVWQVKRLERASLGRSLFGAAHFSGRSILLLGPFACGTSGHSVSYLVH